jgi:hypothetical protein
MDMEKVLPEFQQHLNKQRPVKTHRQQGIANPQMWQQKQHHGKRQKP